jgi:hypothetical protein
MRALDIDLIMRVPNPPTMDLRKAHTTLALDFSLKMVLRRVDAHPLAPVAISAATIANSNAAKE